MPCARPTSLRRVLSTLILVVAPALAWPMPPGGAAPKGAPGAGSLNAVMKDGRRIPLFGDAQSDAAVARVGPEVVTVRDLAEAIAEAHEEHGAGEKGGATDPTRLLGRLVEVRLAVCEAQAMGIEELPEFKAEIEKFTESALRDLLRRQAASRAKVDRAKVDAAYKDIVREWKVSSVLFENEGDAKALAEAAKAGDFDVLAARAAADKKAKAYQQPEYLPEAKMIPAIAKVVPKLGRGKVSGVIKVSGGFALVRVDGARYPESADARQEAEAEVRNAAQYKAVADYTEGLVKKHARIDRKLLASLKYDGKDADATREKLAKDPRVVAWVDGEKAVTIAQLTEALDKKFFHGMKESAKKNKLDREKEPILDRLLADRILLDEARRVGLERSSELKYLVRGKRHSLAFGATLERVLMPEVKVTDADVQAYYDRHAADYTYPAMYKLQGLAFASAVGADDAARKLRSGTDLGWLRANAEGQLDPAKQHLQLRDVPLDVRTAPPAVATALKGTKTGDVRTFVHENEHYVVRVADVTAPTRQPLEDAREEIRAKVYREKLEAAFTSWLAKLRENYPVEILLASVG